MRVLFFQFAITSLSLSLSSTAPRHSETLRQVGGTHTYERTHAKRASKRTRTFFQIICAGAGARRLAFRRYLCASDVVLCEAEITRMIYVPARPFTRLCRESARRWALCILALPECEHRECIKMLLHSLQSWPRERELHSHSRSCLLSYESLICQGKCDLYSHNCTHTKKKRRRKDLQPLSYIHASCLFIIYHHRHRHHKFRQCSGYRISWSARPKGTASRWSASARRIRRRSTTGPNRTDR